MNIAIDCNVFMSQKYGGVTRYLVSLADELAEMGNEVTIHGLLHVNRYLADSRQKITRMRHIDSFPKFTRRISHIAGDLITEVEFLLHSPDVIHESYYHSRKVGSSKLPRVCTVHDFIHDIYPEYWSNQDNSRELRQQTIDRADAIICVSENTRQDLLRITDIDPAKTHVVHHGFEMNLKNYEMNDLEKRSLEQAILNPYLLYVGDRSAYKNFLGFLEGFSRSIGYKDVRIIAFGGGHIRNEERSAATRLGIPEASILQISGGDSLLRELYQNAIAFIYPSYYEGFGIPPLEAMSMGCPVLASNTSCIPEIVGDSAILFDPRECDEIAHAINEVQLSNNIRSELITKGYKRLANFSWKKCAEETLEVYNMVI